MLKASRLISMALAATAAVLGWLLFEARQDYRESALELQRMSEHATELEQRILELEEEKLALEKRTLDGLIQQGGDSVVESWSQMADHFAREMERLGQVLEEHLEEKGTQSGDESKDPI